eukprot:GFUD01020270.1.p1 GENE.GFUD01020270.1~~GFUD01020270.1.p1  ORF type:complete len:364 (+),score=85.68 GFUD01020270.1:39-1130(+)
MTSKVLETSRPKLKISDGSRTVNTSYERESKETPGLTSQAIELSRPALVRTVLPAGGQSVPEKRSHGPQYELFPPKQNISEKILPSDVNSLTTPRTSSQGREGRVGPDVDSRVIEISKPALVRKKVLPVGSPRSPQQSSPSTEIKQLVSEQEIVEKSPPTDVNGLTLNTSCKGRDEGSRVIESSRPALGRAVLPVGSPMCAEQRSHSTENEHLVRKQEVGEKIPPAKDVKSCSVVLIDPTVHSAFSHLDLSSEPEELTKNSQQRLINRDCSKNSMSGRVNKQIDHERSKGSSSSNKPRKTPEVINRPQSKSGGSKKNRKFGQDEEKGKFITVIKEESNVLFEDSDDICNFVEEYQNLDLLFQV